MKVGSICSGIEAASVAWRPLGMEFDWFSEIADFPSQILKAKYPDKPNLGVLQMHLKIYIFRLSDALALSEEEEKEIQE